MTCPDSQQGFPTLFPPPPHTPYRMLLASFVQNFNMSQVCWSMPIIPAFRKLRWEDCSNLRPTLSHTSPGLPGTPHLKTKQRYKLDSTYGRRVGTGL